MRANRFPVTQLTIVIQAGGDFSRKSQDAIASLCEVYWYPLYAFIRRRGHMPEQAQDLTQEFFARFLEGRYVRTYRRERGRFRSFLLGCLKHFLSNQRKRDMAEKRGGGKVDISLEAYVQTGENRYRLEPHDNLTPESIYEKQWALTVFNQALARLQREFEEKGKKERFAFLEPFLLEDKTGTPYSELAARIGMSESALKVAIHRIKRRFLDLLRDQISHTVSRTDQIDKELQYLMSIRQ
jgi:RNA polymerase sigma factor (sigma-70 family)